MSPHAPTNDWVALGPMLKARREQLELSRAQIRTAGGPSPATLQRIEAGDIKTDIDSATKSALERTYQLPAGWINEQLGIYSPQFTDDPEPVVIEESGERILVAIAEGVSQLSLRERRAVLRLVHELQKETEE